MGRGQVLDQLIVDGLQIGPRGRVVQERGQSAFVAMHANLRVDGTSPNTGTSNSAARRRAPPLPKMSYRLLHAGHTNPLMFSTIPSTGMLTLRNMAIAFTASSSATSCGCKPRSHRSTAATARGSARCRRFRAACRSPGSRAHPARVAQELRDRPVQHGSSPHHRLAGRHQQSHGHDLQTILVDGLDALVTIWGRPVTPSR